MLDWVVLRTALNKRDPRSFTTRTSSQFDEGLDIRSRVGWN